MNFQIDVSSALNAPPPPPPLPPAVETVELLRQILEIQREQLACHRAAAAAHDALGRWRGFLQRWQQEFADLGEACRKSMPALERCYGQMLKDLTDRLNDEDDSLDSDFAVQEFLDRYGMRLAQLGTILNLVGPLAEAGGGEESSG
jgi:hypothetical protein